MEERDIFILFTGSVLSLLLLVVSLRLWLVRKRYESYNKHSLLVNKNRTKQEELVNSASDILYSADRRGVFTYVNNTVTDILGYQPSEILGQKFEYLVHPDHLENLKGNYQEHFSNKNKESYQEFLVKRKDGGVVWVGQKVTTIFNQKKPDQVEGFYGIVRDINDRKKIQLDLRASEARYRHLFNNTSELIHSLDAKGNILYANKSWISKLGYSEEELASTNYFSIIHPNSWQHCSEIIKKITEGDFPNEPINYDLLSKTGKRISVEGSVNVFDNEGEIVIESFLRDITVQKEAKEELVKQEKTLRQITETINDVFYLFNLETSKYEYVSANSESILGLRSEFFYQNHSYPISFVFPDDVEVFNQSRQIICNGLPYDITYRIVIDDEVKWINEKSFPIKAESGEVVAHSGICRDISELKKAQDTIQRQKFEIESSIRYAKGIQEAVLPNSKTISSVFEDAFVFFKPRNIVSGDFYVVESIRSNNQIYLPSLIVADCTGHGVPGAVLSLMCNVLVRESFTKHHVNSPAQALDFVRSRLVAFFGAQNEIRINDGMDIAFCVFDEANKELAFSGALISCVLVRNGELFIFKGDRQHIGYHEEPIPYTNTVIDIQSNDCVFLFTDGYADQFGGEHNKKYSRKRFYGFLSENAHLSMSALKTKLELEFNEWKGDFDQIDDVTVLGVRFK